MKRRKEMWMIVLLLLGTTLVQGQTFNEWFKQKKTQLRYLREQVVQLYAQIQLVKKGYQVVNDGLTVIHQIKEGEFNLHHAFITSLKNVNPAIKQYANVAELIATQLTLIDGADRLMRSARNSPQFADKERAFFTQALGQFKEEATITLEEIIQITTSGKLEMTDDERILRIRKLKEVSDEQRVDLQKMAGQLELIIRQRLTEAGEIEFFRKLYQE